MQASIKRQVYIRYGSYALGLLLFYVPAALFVRAFYGVQGQGLVGNLCDSLNLRMGVANLLKPDFWQQVAAVEPRSLGVLALMLVAFLVGPVFCGWVCAAGALSEWLSRLVPNRFKIDIQGKVNAAAIRYGFLAGYVLLPLSGLSAACAFCNFRILNFMALGITEGFVPAMTSTYLIVTLLWLVVGGLFMKGGRGWCNFFCPVGGIQGLFHSLGMKLGFTYKLRYDASKCKSCLTCVKVCPMRTVSPAQEGQWQASRGNGVVFNLHNCIACKDCVVGCPHGALSYGAGKVSVPSAPTVVPGVSEGRLVMSKQAGGGA